MPKKASIDKPNKSSSNSRSSSSNSKNLKKTKTTKHNKPKATKKLKATSTNTKTMRIPSNLPPDVTWSQFVTLVQASNKQLESRKMAMVAASPLWKELKYRGILESMAGSLNSAVKKTAGLGSTAMQKTKDSSGFVGNAFQKLAKGAKQTAVKTGSVLASGAKQVGNSINNEWTGTVKPQEPMQSIRQNIPEESIHQNLNKRNKEKLKQLVDDSNSPSLIQMLLGLAALEGHNNEIEKVKTFIAKIPNIEQIFKKHDEPQQPSHNEMLQDSKYPCYNKKNGLYFEEPCPEGESVEELGMGKWNGHRP